MLRASFAEGEIEVRMVADQGAEAILMSKDLFKEIQEELPDIRPATLYPVQIYRGVNSELYVTCNQEVKQDVFLRILHRLNLILRNIVWRVAEEGIQNSTTGRQALESLGFDNRGMLMNARDRYDGEIDVKEWLYDGANVEKR